jgi:hypothetical protein
LNIENPNSLAYIVFANIVSDVLIFFNMSQKNAKTGILIQYEKYKYIKKIKIFLMLKKKLLDIYMEKKLIAAGIKVINPKYNQELIAMTDNSYSVIIGQLNKRKIKIAIII